MTEVKICGLTDPAAAETCAALGADAIGCVFYPKSPRHVSDDRARKIVSALPRRSRTMPVGVFVDEPISTILAKVSYCGLRGVQLHGHEGPEIVDRLTAEGLCVIKGLYTSRPPYLSEAETFRPSGFLVEAGRGKLPGGNAEIWDWGGVRDFGDRYPFVLAGGLSPENVADAAASACPDAVDVSSGVESAPGVKDLDRVRAFLEALTDINPQRPLRRIFTAAFRGNRTTNEHQ